MDPCASMRLWVGGHTALCLSQVGENGRVIAFDRDINAIKHVEKQLEVLINENRLEIVHSPFSHIKSVISRMELDSKVDGIVADIGVSSLNLMKVRVDFI